MTKFSLSPVPAITCSPGALKKVALMVSEGERVLVVADPIMMTLGHLDRLSTAIKAVGANVEEFTDIVSDPKERAVNSAIQKYGNIDRVVALGGGSTMDAAKIIAALAASGDHCEPYRLAAKPLPEKCPLIAIPTTAGTGSEATSISVLTDDEGVKYWYARRGQEPDNIVIDPELFVDLPAFLTAATGLDALVHAMEAATNRHAFAQNMLFAHEAIRLCLEVLPKAVREPENLDVRATMAYAATLGGVAINNSGTAIAHGVGHALGSLTAMHHGLSVTIGSAAALPFITKDNPKFDAIADLFNVKSRDDIASAFEDVIGDVGLEMNHDTKNISSENLAIQIDRPENATMVQSTDYDFTPDVMYQIAEKSLDYMRA